MYDSQAMPPPLDFTAPRILHNAHLMTIVPRYWPRTLSLDHLPQTTRLFTVEPGTALLGYCHWQTAPKDAPTILLVHGLEGSADSRYMRGLAAKAYRAGFNVIRMNQRNCGGTEHLTPTLYNSGLSGDYRTILHELATVDGLQNIWLVGFSMGGNLVLKAAGELGQAAPSLAGVAAVCPNINPALCVVELERPGNWIYHQHFLPRLKSRLRRKALHFPGKWDLSALKSITTMTRFDDYYTAPDGGYRGAADYYDRAGARHVLRHITVPALILTAQDDPFIPYAMFRSNEVLGNPMIHVVAPRHGGHCGFFQRHRADEDPYWAENRIMGFVTGTEAVGSR